MAVEEYKMACLVTTHLTEELAGFLSGAGNGAAFPYTIAAFEEGFFVSCMGARADGDSEAYVSRPDAPDAASLHAVRVWARANGYAYVLLDRDADAQPDLPVYDW